MTLRPLHLLGSPVLRERAQEIETIDDGVRRLVTDLFETMYAAKGIGLAANQIGVARRVAVVDAEEEGRLVLINPVILEQEGTGRDEEGCLSIPDLYGDVDRPVRIIVETTGPDGARTQVEATDLKARAILHEIDHLDGVLFIDHLSPLKRRLLLNKWQKQRKGETGYLKDITPEAVEK